MDLYLTNGVNCRRYRQCKFWFTVEHQISPIQPDGCIVHEQTVLNWSYIQVTSVVLQLFGYRHAGAMCTLIQCDKVLLSRCSERRLLSLSSDSSILSLLSTVSTGNLLEKTQAVQTDHSPFSPSQPWSVPQILKTLLNPHWFPVMQIASFLQLSRWIKAPQVEDAALKCVLHPPDFLFQPWWYFQS